jgi:nucleoside phosphorylase
LLEDIAYDPRFIVAFRGTHSAGPFDQAASAKMPTKRQIDLAIITALPKEREAVEAVFGEGRALTLEGDPHVYHFLELDVAGRIRTVVIGTPSDMGNARAAVIATDMLRTFSPRFTALVGIAGGCPTPEN